ncbi:MAG: SgcJ/EcaC family oxidoreductase [Planctomycetaceae bacterium]|nr:SgcJ/EcaC family oxidoreductase [Planctomycetaceae bacterium]
MQLLRRRPLVAVAVGLTLGIAVVHAEERVVEPLDAVRSSAQQYMDAFNRHDAESLGQLWAEDATYTDRVTGERVIGRAAIQADLAEVFAKNPNIRLQFSPGEIRFIRPDVAQAEASATVILPDEQPVRVSVSALYVKEGDHWLLSSVEEMALPQAATAAEALSELEWLIGDWRDDADDITATSSFRWGAEGSYLIRSFSVAKDGQPMAEGTQVIGWDPRTQQIRSWTFNSDGSFGEANWSRNGDDWMIKSSQTLADGGIATGTYVMTPVDSDAMTVRLIGHEVNGEPQPASEAVTVVRLSTTTAASESENVVPTTGGKP